MAGAGTRLYEIREPGVVSKRLEAETSLQSPVGETLASVHKL